MGKYDGWEPFFRKLEASSIELRFDELEAMIDGPLPSSAYRHDAWWVAPHHHAKWRLYGWVARPDIESRVVHFEKNEIPRRVPVIVSSSQSPARLVLLGCVSKKGNTPAPAKDLYVSNLWRLRRAYAESMGYPWMILSAEHGLVDPDVTLDPYDRYMESQTAAYRDQWSASTSETVIGKCRLLDVNVVEIHAGSAYIDHGLESKLTRAGLEVVRPLLGRRIGEQLAWYAGHVEKSSTPSAPPELETPSVIVEPAELVRRIAHVYKSGILGESWNDLPEASQLPSAEPRSQRLWITLVAAVDRARDAASLWRTANRAWHQDPWIFNPVHVTHRSLTELAETLRRHGLTQRHGPDSHAWRMIAEALISDHCPPAITAAIDGHSIGAPEILRGLESRWPHGTPMFPQLSGVKIGPMWVRMLAFPGGASISDIQVIPVAVDTHVQRVTEMLGLVPVRQLDERHRLAIQQAWFPAVSEAGPFGAPPAIDGTAAGIDPALWALGKEGCSRCERSRRRIPVGSICEVCPLGRMS